MNTLQIAHFWLDKGIGVLPVGYRSKVPDFGMLKRAGMMGDDGKPTWESLKTQLPTSSVIQTWFGAGRQNLGVITGWQGLAVIDFDNLAAYQCWRQWLQITGKRLITYEVLTGRGVHVYIFCEEPPTPAHVGDVDIKANGGYVLAPPSVHPSKRLYVGNDRPIAKVAQLEDVFPCIVDLPVKCVQLGAEYGDPYEEACKAEAPAVELHFGSDAIATIKANVTIAQMLGLSKGETKALCPLHNDHNPSMVIYPDGRFFCHGCGAHGDVLDLHAALHGITLREAMSEMLKGTIR